MLEILAHWFAAVCGQDPGHTWAPGGMLLPCCQRCLGLYVGAGMAALLHLCVCPRLNGRFLELHGAFLLLMVPFGFHWLAQGPVVRTLTGILFGFGVVTFLWLPVSQKVREWAVCSPSPSPLERGGPHVGLSEIPGPPGAPTRWRAFSLSRRERAGVRGNKTSNRRRLPTYQLLVACTLVVVPTVAVVGGAAAAYALSGLALWGALALGVLVAANLGLGVLGASRLLRRFLRPALLT